MSNATLFERALEHDRRIVLAALSIIIIASWAFILNGAGTGMSVFAMTSWSMAFGMDGLGAMVATPADWTFAYALTMVFMWWGMMIAMMLPSAAPMILLHARIARGANANVGGTDGLVPTALFALGYLLTWGLFGVFAAGLQWAFEAIGLLSPMMMNSTSNLFAGAILLFAGLYELSPIKQACLSYCRGPIQFLSRFWRTGPWGSLQMGGRHGAYCIGCCWALMVILFFGGIMNLYWIIGLAVFILLEKMLPAGGKLSRLMGALLVVWGLSFVYRGIA